MIETGLPIPLLDLRAQYRAIRSEIAAAMERVLDSQHFILGPEVEAFEREVAAYCGTDHAVGVSSGSDALLVSLMAAGIGAGDEVITTAYSFAATAGAVLRLGARPVLVDVSLDDLNLAPDRLDAAVTPRTKAILPVYLYGQLPDMDPITAVARARNLVLIEDAAQAIGAEDRGRRAGSIGDYGCFSFFPSKNLGAFGDGGLVTTSDGDLADRIRMLRAHGSSPKYYAQILGGNFRLDALQAAVLRVKLRYLDEWTERRRRNAAHYRMLLADLPAPVDPALLVTPLAERPHARHVYNQFVVMTPQRDELRRWLATRGIATEVYYPYPLHEQPCFAELAREGELPNSERAARESLSLPVYPELGEAAIGRIVAAIGHWQRGPAAA